MGRCYWVRASDGCELRAQFSGAPDQETIDALDAVMHAVKEHPEAVFGKTGKEAPDGHPDAE